MATSLTNTGVTFPDATSQTTAGVPPSGTGASGTWGISISGAAASAESITGTTTAAIPTSALASGTADSSKVLLGDRTWGTLSGGVTSLNGQTGAITNTSFNAIGSYVIAYSISGNTTYSEGSTIAGSSLGRASSSSRAGTNFNGSSSAGPAYNNSTSGYALIGATGTWRSMTRSQISDLAQFGTYYFTNLWVRIS